MNHARHTPSFRRAIQPHVDAELAVSWRALHAGTPEDSFRHLERAHVLAQPSTWEHVRVHAHMLAWALRTRHAREVIGQLLRIGGAATKTPLGLVPVGNTGGTNVSPLKAMPVPPDLARIIASARQRAAS